MVEAVRFELTDPFEPSVFKTGAINRTLPHFHKNYLGVTYEIRTRTNKVTTCSANHYTKATPK